MIERFTWAVAISLAAGAAAAQSVDVPAGCEATLTVHKDSCYATTYMTCGDRVDAVSYAKGNLQDRHIFGPGWDLAGYFADVGGMGTLAVEGSAPEANLRQALDTGKSVGSREMEMATGVLKGEAALMDSEMTFGDETVEIGGTTFRVGNVTRLFTIKKNGVTSSWSFVLYAPEDASLLIEGNAEFDQFGRKSTLEWTPRKLSRPGEAGFLATTSDIACD